MVLVQDEKTARRGILLRMREDFEFLVKCRRDLDQAREDMFDGPRSTPAKNRQVFDATVMEIEVQLELAERKWQGYLRRIAPVRSDVVGLWRWPPSLPRPSDAPLDG